MSTAPVRITTLLASTFASFFTLTTPAKAYPIDCAILLCLSGGWPASAECAAAKAEFIRRITPWPIEPPLQIWRCPMGSAMNHDPATSPIERLRRFASSTTSPKLKLTPAVLTRGHDPRSDFVTAAYRNSPAASEIENLVKKVAAKVSDENGVADMDISGAEFDFVRSIKVWDVRSYRHREQGENGDCAERSWMFLGTYGEQGDFNHRRTSHVGAPEWVLPNRSCGWGSWRRGVGVEWQDYEGNQGYEWVSY